MARNLPPPQHNPTQRSDALILKPSADARCNHYHTVGGMNWHISTIREYCQSNQCVNYEIVKKSPNLIDVLR